LAGLQRKPIVGVADQDWVVAVQLGGADNPVGRHQDCLLPGEIEATLDQQVTAVGGDDLAFGAGKLKATQR